MDVKTATTAEIIIRLIRLEGRIVNLCANLLNVKMTSEYRQWQSERVRLKTELQRRLPEVSDGR